MDPYYIQIVYVISLLFATLMCVAAAADVTKFIIPNTVVVGVVALFCGAAIMLPFEVRWEMHLGALVAVLAVGLVCYRFKILGAGDVKLISALALWTGFEHLPTLLLSIAVAGGALGIFMVVFRKVLFGVSCRFPKFETAMRGGIFQIGAKIPYGVAIAVGGVVTAFSLPHLGLFLEISPTF